MWHYILLICIYEYVHLGGHLKNKGLYLLLCIPVPFMVPATWQFPKCLLNEYLLNILGIG